MIRKIWHIIKAARRGIAGVFTQTVRAFKTFRENVIWNLSAIFAGLACVVTIIGLIVTYIKFWIDGGYSAQIASIRGETVDNIQEIMEKQNIREQLFNKIIFISFLILLVSFLLLLVSYILKTTLVMRIIALADCAVIGGSGWVISKYFENASVLEKALIAGAAAFLLLIILMCISEHRILVGHFLKSFLIAIIGGYLTWLLAENFIQVLHEIIIAVFSCVVIVIVLMILLEGLHSSGGENDLKDLMKNTQKTDRKEGNSKEPNCYDYDSNVKVYVKENTWGKQVYVETPFATRHICSYADYKAGKFIIKIKGKRVSL